MTARVALTYRDYAALPDDGKRYEIHDGELSVTPAPTSDHQIISARLFTFLYRHVEAHVLGIILAAPLDVILADTAIVQPDIVYLDRERRPALQRRGVEEPPTLVIEILSERTATTDRGTKRQLYAHHGIPYFWIADPSARVVEALTLRTGAYEVTIRASGPEPVDVPPFTDLALVPSSLWP